MAEKNKVELEVAEDENTGLVLHIFKWREGDEIKLQVEVANRSVPGSALPIRVFAYDKEIDGAIGESRRAMIEKSLTESVPSA